MSNLWFRGFLTSAALLLTSQTQGATVTLNPAADTQIYSGLDGQGNLGVEGSGTAFGVGKTGPSSGETFRGLFRFDIPVTVPTNAVVTSATITYRVTKSPSGGVASTFALQRLKQSWTELGATWAKRDAANSWQTPGAFGANDVVSTASTSVNGGTAQNVTLTFTNAPALVADIQGWVNNPSSNFGWLLRSLNETTGKTARVFGARENATPGNRPVLTVNYTIPVVPPTAPTLSSPTHAAQEITFQFAAQANQAYAVEGRDSLNSGSWLSQTNLAAAPNASTRKVVLPIQGQNRFYRVRASF